MRTDPDHHDTGDNNHMARYRILNTIKHDNHAKEPGRIDYHLWPDDTDAAYEHVNVNTDDELDAIKRAEYARGWNDGWNDGDRGR